MKSKLFATSSLGVCLLSPILAQAAGLDGLYFKMTMSFGNINQDHWWFLPDGRYFNIVPPGGLDPARFESNCQKTPAVCGSYEVQGGKLDLAPRKGKPYGMAFKQLPGGNIELDGLFTKHVDKFGTTVKLDGHYSWSGGASGGGTAVSASRGYRFNPDGSYTTRAAMGVSARQGGATSTTAGDGTYKLGGNLLELTNEGKTTRYTAYPYDLGKGDVRLNIDGEMYKLAR